MSRTQFSRLHLELREELLLYLPYKEILGCLTYPEFSFLSSRSAFWERKAAQAGVSASQFRREQRASLSERYVECVSYYSRYCLPECEKYIGPDEALLRAVEMGDLQLVGFFLKMGSTATKKACSLAAKQGVPEIFKLLYSSFEASSQMDSDLVIVRKLARHNQMESLKWLKSQYVFSSDDFECTVAEGAARGGHVALLEKSLEYMSIFCPDQIVYVINYAAHGGNYEIFRSIVARTTLPAPGTSEFHTLVHSAARGGNQAILDFLGTDDWNVILEGAAIGGHLELVKYVIEKGVDRSEFSNAISHAVEHCRAHIIRYLAPFVEIPDDRDIADIFYIREQKLTRELVEALYDTKFTDHSTVFIGAAVNGNIDILETTYPLLLTLDRILRESTKDIALENAVRCNRYTSVRWLLQHCGYNKAWAAAVIFDSGNERMQKLLG